MLLKAIRQSQEKEKQALQKGNREEGICLSDAEDDNDMDTTPLRLIDVEATVRNRNAGGVFFTRRRRWHVISHTWSADVRELSEIIGERLASAVTMQQLAGRKDDPDPLGHRSYEKLFKTAGFDKELSYKKLVEFLIILRSDGVRWVWFDAVCINQQDKKEKEREIEHMGMYYERSVGCHVVHHGIGRGFEVLSRLDWDDGEEEEMLPRWFSRAWTFQEWILPPKITFVINLASEQILARTALGILLDEYKHDKTCSCCYFETSLSPIYVRNCMMKHPHDATAAYDGSVKVEIREDDEDLASLPRNRTRRCCRPSIDDAHFRKVPNRRSWYFADDLGFAFLARVKLQMAKLDVAHDSCNLSPAKEREMALSAEEYELTRRMDMKGYFRGESDYSITKEKKIRLTIEEMQVRNCSNPEDRVLSALKMLGVENVMQVRSGKSLEEQVIHLIRVFLQQRDDAMVMQLCLVDGFGNETRAMSWAPYFEVKKGSWQARAKMQELAGTRIYVAADHFESFKADAEVKELSSDGGLRLAAGSVCLGHLVCCEHQYTARVDPRRTTEGREPFRRMVLQVNGQTLVYLCARIACATIADRGVAVSRDEYACVLDSVGVETSMRGRACIAFPTPADEDMSPPDYLHYLRERIPVWLVKIGVGMHNTSSVTYFLVCIGEQTLESPLHKIGYVGISSTDKSSALLADKPALCYVAGIGSRTRLHEHIFRMADERWTCMNFSNCCCAM